MPTAKGIKSIVRLMKIGEPRSEKKIRGATKWTIIIDITRNGVVSVISAIVWFGIGCICGAIILVSFSAITYDERKRKTMREGYKPNEIRPNSNNGYIRSNGNIAQQEKERTKDEIRTSL